VVLAGFLVAAEGLSRLPMPQVPTWQGVDTGRVVMVGHRSRLWAMGTGVRMNGGASATISPLGLREPVPPVPRPPGRQRLMLLGDSTYFGHGVADDQTVGVELQRQLTALGVDVDVVNAAIPGYSTEQSRMLLDDVGWDLQPTLLILASLWSDNNFDLYRDRDLLHTQASFTTGLAARSSFVRLLASWVDGLAPDSRARIVTWTRTSDFPTSGTRRVPLNEYAGNLDRMIRDAAERGVGAVILAPSNRYTVMRGRQEGQVWWTYFAAQEHVARCHGVPLIDTLPDTVSAIAAGVTLDQLYIDEMHPTTLGHQRIATTIVQALLGAGWPSQSLLGRSEPCPVDQLQDAYPSDMGAMVQQLSPQANLFPGTGPAEGPQSATVTDGSILPRGAWQVSGAIRTSAWPVQVVVLDMEGRTLDTVVLATAQTPVTLTVNAGLDRVSVVVTDAAGVTASAIATTDHPRIDLGLHAAP
jgi:lysophospholipase L1-like esterase